MGIFWSDFRKSQEISDKEISVGFFKVAYNRKEIGGKNMYENFWMCIELPTIFL